ncbi:MAG TPA: bifunctional pyr operon transcriptional regulator/uracil phosphoribosyltransferase PyrR [Acidobacteriota bacterium]|nr:bifunctional pyr operon transcriptional regulator/uracil phosphoribosyltransferase PyrR [Acidobacteriota bacterium]
MNHSRGRFKARILDATAIHRALNRIAHEIVERNPNVGDIVLIGIHTRGVPLAQRLAAIIRGIEGSQVEVGTINISLYREDLSTVADHPIITKPSLPFSIDHKTLILVDDVLYTGKTVLAALEEIKRIGTPRSIQLAVLIDRGHREVPIHADYIGKNVPTALNEIVHILLKETDHDEQVIITERAHETPVS